MPAPTITGQPHNQTVVAGQNTRFQVQANGIPAPTFQWQVRTTPAGAWVNVVNGPNYADVTTNTLSVTGALITMNRYQYQVVVTNTDGNVTSSPVVLTVTAVVATVPAVGTGTTPPTANVHPPIYNDQRVQVNTDGSGTSQVAIVGLIVALALVAIFLFAYKTSNPGGTLTVVNPTVVVVPRTSRVHRHDVSQASVTQSSNEPSFAPVAVSPELKGDACRQAYVNQGGYDNGRCPE